MEEKIANFIESLSKTYNLDLEFLKKTYNEISERVDLFQTNKYTLSELNVMKLADINRIYKRMELKGAVKKKDKISAILGEEFISNDEKKKIKPRAPTKKQKKLFEEKELDVSVIKNLMKEVKVHIIRKNANNHYEDVKTHLIFDEVSKKAIGRENEKGKVIQLTDEDIVLCKKVGFDYSIPENLDKYNKKNKIKIEELGNDDLEEEEVDEEEVEEEVDEEEVE